MQEPELIDIFAMFAMKQMQWCRGEEYEDAIACYEIAQAMMKARENFLQEEQRDDRA